MFLSENGENTFLKGREFKEKRKTDTKKTPNSQMLAMTWVEPG